MTLCRKKTGMTRIRTIINKNNVALTLIETGKYHEAIGTLKFLIQQVQDDLKTQAAQQDTHSEPRSALVCHLLLQSTTDMMNRRGASGDELESFLYDQPIEIPLKVAMETPAIAANVISTVLLFNLALALHLKAIAATKEQSQSTRDRLFASSLSLYRLVMTLNSTNRLLSMIVLNNVALIHQALQDQEKAQQCFSHLLAIWVVSQGECPQDLEGMVYNAMGLYDTSSLPAAAA